MEDENYELKRGSFKMSDLERIEPPRCPALLRSGGPILDVLDVDEEGWAHCQWDIFTDGVKGAITGAFKAECLYRLVPFVLSQNDRNHPAAASDVAKC